MQEEVVLEALKKLREVSPKRNFKQSVDLILSFKDLDLKKPDNQIDAFIVLHRDKGKKTKICAFTNKELEQKAKEVFDKVISESEFDVYKDKKLAKKLSKGYDFFVASSNIMPKVAMVFGKFLGPRGKMPNPKAGCVITNETNLKALNDKLQKTIHLVVKQNPFFQCLVGKEDMSDEDIKENIMTIYNSLIHLLPNEKHNINKIYIKFTMGPVVEIGKGIKVKLKKKQEKQDEKENKEKKINKEEKRIKKQEKAEEKNKSKEKNKPKEKDK